MRYHPKKLVLKTLLHLVEVSLTIKHCFGYQRMNTSWSK